MTTAQLHTVEISIPGTDARILVRRLLCAKTDACSQAKNVLVEIATCRTRLSFALIDTEDVIDVPPFPEPT